jgi:hypothetical protein
MSEQRFTTVMQKIGAKTVIAIPFNPNEAWGSKERHDVTGTVGGHSIRGPLVADGTSFYLSIGPAWLRDNPIEDGAAIEVELAPEGPQVDSLPADIGEAFEAEPQAIAFFNSLSSYYRKNYMRWVESAKRPETRAARIAEMIQLLKDGKREK